MPSHLSALAGNGLCHILGHGLVLLELHRVVGSAFGQVAQLGDVAEHLCQWHACIHDVEVATRREILDDASTAVQVTDDAAHVLLGGDDLDLHDRLHDDGLCLAGSLLEDCPGCNLESNSGRVDRVESTILQFGLDVHDWEAHADAVQELALGALDHCRHVLLWNRSANNFVGELEALTRVGLEGHAKLRILARTTRLLLVGVPELDWLCDRLSVRDLGLANVGFYLELALEAVDNDLQVQLTHALDHGLIGLLVPTEAEGRVFSCQLGKRLTHLVRILLRARLTGDLNHGLREFHLLQHNGGVHCAQGVTCGGVLQSHNGDDVACLGLLDFLALVGMHENHAAHALLGLGPGVPNHLSALDLARINAVEGQGADVRVRRHLEGQAGKLLLWLVLALDLLLLVLGVLALGRGKIDW
mmetsp:Transcript_102239/g.142348  ORF Transcript_102239/g.142348 Transcript_102239/m.142348 type:complete len:416 (+) Transcript_102239:264-1511(+)